MEARIYWIDRRGVGRIGIMPRPRGGDWLEDEISSLRNSGVELLVSLLTDDEVNELQLTDESSLCERFGLSFFRFPIADRQIPQDDKSAGELITFLSQELNSGKTIVAHCRMGIGRSSMLAAAILVAGGMSVENAFQAIGSTRGSPVPDTEDQFDWVASLAKRLGVR